MFFIRFLIVLLLALAAPYAGLSFIELEWRPDAWSYWSRAALAVIYAAYLLLIVSVLTESRKAQPKQ